MEKIILLVLPFFAASCGLVKQQASAPEPVNVMSFNIRYDNPEDSLDNWRYRKDRVANAIHFYDVDILGTQEVLHNQLEDLKLRLPEYGVVGVGREDGKEKGEYSALWYKKDRFNVLDSGYFWLSETPEVAGSKGWDGACERIASWVKLQDKVSDKEYFALNTHLDHAFTTKSASCPLGTDFGMSLVILSSRKAGFSFWFGFSSSMMELITSSVSFPSCISFFILIACANDGVASL